MQELQPFRTFEFEKQVEVGRSLIDGAGYGLFARVDIKCEDIVCVYTGECRKGRIGRFGNKFMLECSWYNAESDKWEDWYIDSYDPYNAAGRFLNDAHNTEYANNCSWDGTCSSAVHTFVRKYYVNIRALEDIAKGEELLMSYGANYWQMHEKYIKGKMHDTVLDI